MSDLEASGHSGLAAFHHIDYTLFQLERFCIVAALEMLSVAVGWQVYEITRRPLDLGFVGLAQFLPNVFLFLLAGPAADRFSRKNLLMICNLGFALCCALLIEITQPGTNSVRPIYVVLVLLGIVRAFNSPARRAMLPVDARDILRTGPWGLGVLRAALGVGASMMAVLLAYRPLRRRVGKVMLFCVAGFGVFTVVFGISHSLILSLIALALVGASD